MNTSHRTYFSVACTIGKEKLIAYTIIDKKNNSIHLHLFGMTAGSKRTPIEVKNSDIILKEGSEMDTITQILTDHYFDHPFQITKIRKLHQPREVSATEHALRIIVRLKDYQASKGGQRLDSTQR